MLDYHFLRYFFYPNRISLITVGKFFTPWTVYQFECSNFLSILRRLLWGFLLLFCFFTQTVFAAGTYSYNSNGSEVTDVATGLIWRRCSEGQTWDGSTCTGVATRYTHEGALVAAQSQAGWRLPNIKELFSIVEKANIDPAINRAAFPNTSFAHWSSTPYISNYATGSEALSVSFYGGEIFWQARTFTFYVRLVR